MNRTKVLNPTEELPHRMGLVVRLSKLLVLGLVQDLVQGLVLDLGHHIHRLDQRVPTFW